MLSQLAANALVGYVFGRILAYMFGISAAKDGFDIAYSIPFIILNVSGFVFGHAVITAHFAKLRLSDPAKVQAVFSTLLHMMLLAGGVMMAACVVWDAELIRMLAPGLPDLAQEQARRSMLLLLPLTLTLGISTYLSAVLVAYQVPFTAECCQLLSRLGIVVWFFAVGPTFGLEGIAIGLVAASLIGLVVTWLILRRQSGLRLTMDFAPRGAAIRGLLWQAGSFLVASLAAQVSMAYMRRAATLDAVGTNAMLTYCFGLLTPLSTLIGKPLSIVIGPQYIVLREKRRLIAARRLLLQNIAASTTVGLAIAAVLSWFAGPFIQVLYQGGSFDGRAVRVTAELCSALAWSIPPSILLWVILVPTINGSAPLVPGIIYTSGYVLQIVATASLFPLYGRSGLIAAYLSGIYLQALLGTAVAIRDCFKVRLPSVVTEHALHGTNC